MSVKDFLNRMSCRFSASAISLRNLSIERYDIGTMYVVIYDVPPVSGVRAASLDVAAPGVGDGPECRAAALRSASPRQAAPPSQQVAAHKGKDAMFHGASNFVVSESK